MIEGRYCVLVLQLVCSSSVMGDRRHVFTVPKFIELAVDYDDDGSQSSVYISNEGVVVYSLRTRMIATAKGISIFHKTRVKYTIALLYHTD